MDNSIFRSQFTLGILGGGQLGCMLIESCLPYNIPVSVLDSDPDAPASRMTNHFTKGDITDYETVYRFGKTVDLLTIEIENVNVEALRALKSEGVQVYPDPETIYLVQDKGLQREFYQKQGFPVPEFLLTENAEDVKKAADFLPAVHKTRKAGYDGRGVVKLRGEKDLENAFQEPGVLEKLIDIDKEISVITARSRSGKIIHFDPVELVFHDDRNMLDYLLSPADLSEQIKSEAVKLALTITESLGMIGILAVELFLDKNGKLFVNEIAPRPHNSGHQTIEGSYTSQYEQHLRAILDLPFGSTENILPSVMINLLGEDGFEGDVTYEGIEDALGMKGAYVHLYGKTKTRPFRKMGHITVLADNVGAALENAKILQKKVKVKA
ncbi:MAG: 5-(carboxyamino)imidazole ribonucleotide synthase [Spirochaetia bacterium]|nr:5-(carboxyamino)imidazole ribonucleotide synthase [Spirochaetia bacterium]